MALWGGRFEAGVAEVTQEFGASLPVDKHLYKQDIAGSKAHAKMLAAQGIISAEDEQAIAKGLTGIEQDIDAGNFTFDINDEDIHMSIESELTRRIGEAGKRLHTGRSRNDQVATDTRLGVKALAKELMEANLELRHVLVDAAKKYDKVILPGYTHMQQAMPSSVALWAGGFAAEIRDDVVALRHAHRRISKNPLGSAAGYGTPNLPVKRDGTRTRLDFAENQEPVTAVQLSRGKGEAEILFQVTLLMQDLGRLASDLLLFYTREFGFVDLPDAFTTGSSIMPQKRNPDVFELVRGRTATAQACLAEVLAITAKLPSGYQRDLQLIKAPLFRSLDACHESLDILAAAIPQIRFRAERIRMDDDIHAAAEANELVVKEGIPFREAYRRVGARHRKK